MYKIPGFFFKISKIQGFPGFLIEIVKFQVFQGFQVLWQPWLLYLNLFYNKYVILYNLSIQIRENIKF